MAGTDGVGRPRARAVRLSRSRARHRWPTADSRSSVAKWRLELRQLAGLWHRSASAAGADRSRAPGARWFRQSGITTGRTRLRISHTRAPRDAGAAIALLGTPRIGGLRSPAGG